MPTALGGVIAAIITPLDANGEPDTLRLAARARHLLANGCDGLNLLGTTGEATSFAREQRVAVMRGAAANLPTDRMMVGTGAAALRDAIELTRIAAELGFAGALLLPPFYYKPVTTDGLLRYVGAVVEATARTELPIYLYNFPALSGIAYTPEIVGEMISQFGGRIAGLKDSSGDLSYARAIVALSPNLRLFPSNEATLLEAAEGAFAGCISATANLNHKDCAAAFHERDDTALNRAVAVRRAFDGIPLVPAIKAVTAEIEADPTLARVAPPLSDLTEAQTAELRRRLEGLNFYAHAAAQ